MRDVLLCSMILVAVSMAAGLLGMALHTWVDALRALAIYNHDIRGKR